MVSVCRLSSRVSEVRARWSQMKERDRSRGGGKILLSEQRRGNGGGMPTGWGRAREWEKTTRGCGIALEPLRRSIQQLLRFGRVPTWRRLNTVPMLPAHPRRRINSTLRSPGDALEREGARASSSATSLVTRETQSFGPPSLL